MKKHKKNTNKKEQGITLITLVITIIILLILAGISIATLTGENGVLTKANIAGEETKKKNYEEALKLIGNGLRADKIINNWDNKTYLDEFEKEIPKDEQLKDAQINRKSDETIIVITKEGYVYQITENEVKYIGEQGKNELPKLEESNIIFSYSEEDWTNKNVEVTISTKMADYLLQYSTDGTTWKNYRRNNYNGNKWSNLCKISR